MDADSLWSSILQYAFQGKLVPQNPNDEPVSTLLKSVENDMISLTKQVRGRKKKVDSSILRIDDKWYRCGTEREELDVPCIIPSSWQFVYMDDIGTYRKGPFG